MLFKGEENLYMFRTDTGIGDLTAQHRAAPVELQTFCHT